MIPRYSKPEMAQIWSEEARLRCVLEVELLACEAMASLGQVPAEAARICRERADFDIDRVHELDKVLKHDVIAFLTAVNEKIGPEGRFLHKGMTSSDVLDTATGAQIRKAGDVLLAAVDAAMEATKARALETKHLVSMGRTHGVHAEPMCFGMKFAGWYDDFRRGRVRLAAAIDEAAVGAISGAVGTYAWVDPAVEAHVCENLNITPCTITTQVVPRDRHAALFSAMAILASAMERMAVEIRHLQRSEVREAEEAFSKGQKGSSAMPHKRNPVLSENITGLARLVRSFALPAMENVALWHERDISHSSVERVILPDAFITLHFMLHRFTGLVSNLTLYPENMKRNLESLGGIFFSQRLLLALVESGLTREESYAIAQRNAMQVWAGEGTLRELVDRDEDVSSRLDASTLDEVFQIDAYVRNVDLIFDRVFGEN
ncbi:MAG: adenylosuccinate lyase [Deltaproteobacteria bacterium]|nr:adenylosuccinate lyase [Deltaproteobacteria bacterium]